MDELAPRDVVSRAMAARMADPGRGPPLARCHRARALLAALPDHRRLAGVHRARPAARLAAHRPGGAPPLGRRRDRPVGCHRAARACGRWARWPARACTAPTGWPRTPSSRAWSSGPAWPSTSRRGRWARSRAARCGPSWARSRSTGSGAPCWSVPRLAVPPGTDRLPGVDVTKLRDTLQRAMTRGAGVVRSAESLGGARAVLEDIAATLGDGAISSVAAGELANLLQVADALLGSALARTESRGSPRAARVPRGRPGLAPPPGARADRQRGVARERHRSGPGDGRVRPCRRRRRRPGAGRGPRPRGGPDCGAGAPGRDRPLRAAGAPATASSPGGTAPRRPSAGSTPPSPSCGIWSTAPRCRPVTRSWRSRGRCGRSSPPSALR